MDAFDRIAAERRSIVEMLEGLSAEQWETQSLCAAWTVKECAAHLTGLWNIGTFKFMGSMVRNRGNFDKVMIDLTRGLSARPADEIVNDLRSHVSDRTVPPGAGALAPLCDVLVHAQDIAVPLGIEHRSDPGNAAAALEMAASKKAKQFHPSGGIDGIAFRAVDADWSFGSGVAVEGNAIDLLTSMFARTHALGELKGAGADAYRARF